MKKWHVIYSRQGNDIRIESFEYYSDSKAFIRDLLESEYLDIVLVNGKVYKQFKS